MTGAGALGDGTGRRGIARGLRAAACAAAGLLAAGCASRLTDLDGPRDAGGWITPAPGPGDPASDLSVTFLLRNRGIGPVRVDSVRVPVSTEVRTVPTLPASIPAGRTIEVSVVARFRAGDGDATRIVRLEAAGQAPLELAVRGRLRPVPPTDSSGPSEVGGAGIPSPAR